MRKIPAILTVCGCLLLSACAAANPSGSPTDPTDPYEDAPLGISAVAERSSLLYAAETAPALTQEQERLLLDYMDRCFASLADFTVRDSQDLFAAEAVNEAKGNEAVWAYLIGLRRLQPGDLRLLDYRCTLTVIDAQTVDGELHITALEDSTQNFAAYPGVDSESYGTYHLFSMRETEDGWKLTQHSQWDYLYSTIMDQTREFYEQPGAFPAMDYDARVQSLLADAAGYRAQRENADFTETPAAAHPYDRAAAVAYAHLWAQGRNEEWPDYTRSGGNCQNYASQCLLAGGIPMDSYGSAVWKWYGSSPNNTATAAGRSASWSAVKQFAAYADTNTGYGLSAQVNAPYYSGEAGDVIVMGNSDDWRHIVVITDVIKDAEGQTIDYLVDSNTGGMKNFPVSAHPYSCQMLIRILGWND